MEYRVLFIQLALLYCSSTCSDAVPVIYSTFGIIILQQHYLWCSTSYLPYSSHHCTYNSTISDAVPVTCLTVDITVFTTTLYLMQYQLLALQLTSLNLQQHYIWCSTSYLPYSWHHCIYNNTISDAVPVTCLTVDITVPKTTLTLMQYQLLSLQFASMYLQ
jgi:hypothetical protein